MPENAILAENLVKSFGDVQALRGLDLAVTRGSIYGLLGPNGAGKTTAVRIFTTILKPDKGHAKVLDIDVARHPQAVRERIGLAGQFAAIDENLTGRENLRLIGRLTHLPPSEVDARSNDLLDRFGLLVAADRPSKTYSGGMRRRLDLAAALVHRPPVLFLDEPTTGLDPASRKDLWIFIEELVADGTTVLLTTQYLEEADRLADRIAVVDQGVVIEEGTPSELKARLGATVVDLAFKTEADAANAERLLRDSDILDEIKASPRVEGPRLELAVDNGPTVVITILRALDSGECAPSTLSVREPSLDDVFLTLTGRHVDERGSEKEGSSEGIRRDGPVRKPE